MSTASNKLPLILAVLIGLGFLAAGFVMKNWLLTAVPIGLLFGFFLQKADLCGSSSFSEILMFKDRSKVIGLWVIIVVSMIGFALLDAFGLIKLNPKPLQWASALVGGGIFGVGTVLAGGCISGALFKCGQGNLNSMAALVAIPIGVSAVAHGPLQSADKWLQDYNVPATGGGPVTLMSLTGLPYGVLALGFATVTLGVAVSLRKKAKPKASNKPFLYRPWKPWQAGIAIGILASLAYLSSAATGRNYPLGVTHGVMHVQTLLTDYPLNHVVEKKAPAPKPPKEATDAPKEADKKAEPPKAPALAPKRIVWWLVLLVLGVVAGSFASAKIDGKFRLLPKPPDEMLVAFGGGLLVGVGAAIAGGCVVGNIMSGFALMSVGNIVFGVATVAANWITTYVYLMGGLSRSSAGD
jgi:hypothetical protein